MTLERSLAREESSLVKNEHFRVGLAGLTVQGTPTFKEWERFGAIIATFGTAAQWAIGDWINYGETAYGEKYAQAMDVTRKSYQGLANAAWVCRQFDLSRRRENLSFSHHAEVAALEPRKADKLLAKAQAERWSAADLRDAARAVRKGAAPEKALATRGPLCPFEAPATLVALVEWLEGASSEPEREDKALIRWLRAHLPKESV